MIATVLQRKSYEEILALLDDPWIELAEIRLDLCDLSDAEIEDLFSQTDTPLIATCRADWSIGATGDKAAAKATACAATGEKAAAKAAACAATGGKAVGLSPAEAERRLTLAIRSGARYADLELEAEAEWSKRFRDLCHECGTEIIRSYHDFSGTPALEFLRQIQQRCYRYGADIAKIVTTATSKKDCETIRQLYDFSSFGDFLAEQYQRNAGLPVNVPVARSREPRRLIAFAMGKAGKESRLDCLRDGAPFTYASLTAGEETAAGQMDYLEMHRRLYGNFRGFWRVGGDLPMPCSKSFAQRAIICAALADGRSHLYGYTPCEDNESAIAVARAFGASVRKDGGTLTVDGIGASGAKGRLALSELNTGESGLLTRICIPLLAAINTIPVKISGEKTLLQRPLKGVQNVMASFGVALRSERVPMIITPPLIPGNAEISGADGSQIISGLLTALPLCAKNSTLYISEPKSIPYMFITEDILKKFGVRIKSEMEGDERLIEEQDWSGCSQISFTIKGGQSFKPANLTIEGDWSAAANFLVAGAIFGKAEVSGLSTDSLQADLSIADILVQAGAGVSEVPTDEDDSYCNVCVSKAPLEGFEADLANSPDLFPICSVLAAFCDGETVLHGVDRLHGKESDRAAAIMEMLEGLGVTARINGNDLSIKGETLSQRLAAGRLLRGGRFSTHHDHRMAMALKIASMGAGSAVEMDDTDCVAKSFPEFWELFDY